MAEAIKPFWPGATPEEWAAWMESERDRAQRLILGPSATVAVAPSAPPSLGAMVAVNRAQMAAFIQHGPYPDDPTTEQVWSHQRPPEKISRGR